MTERVSVEAISGRLRSFLAHQIATSSLDLAPALGVGAPDLHAFMHGEKPSSEFLIDAAVGAIDHFGVDAEWLFTGEYSAASHRLLEESGPPPRLLLRSAMASLLLRDHALPSPSPAHWELLGG